VIDSAFVLFFEDLHIDDMIRAMKNTPAFNHAN
jgi:hypothetical protein